MIKNILEYLEAAALQFPDKIAFADENTSCTYQELQERAKKIGSALIKKITPRTPVPIFMEKSVDTIAVFMGIIYAGGFYIVLDVKQPRSRLEHILETIESQLIVTNQIFEKELLAQNFQMEVLSIEDLEKIEIEEEALQKVRAQAMDIDPLYGIFTSGSTGIPKGVVVSHRSVIDFMECFTDIFAITSNDVIGNQAPFDFDVSVKDIYSTLKTGATMEIIPKRMFSFPTQLIDYLIDRNVTTVIWAVSALCMISTLKGFDYKIPEKIKKILFSGEVMPMKHLNIWRKAYPEAMFVNLYGPTEITCNCSYYIVDREFELGQVLPMGFAFPNEKILLLDEQDQLVTKPGIQGELCVSGTALALGYYNNKEQTDQAFMQNPLNKHYLEPIYRTGDLAYYNEFGELCFATRKDFQIKHMGHRIELGEIEAAMEQVVEIIRVCCIFDDKKNKIVAFYEGNIERREIISQLGDILPAFMIPNVFRKVEALPITKNGKIDRSGLKSEYQGGKR